MKKFWGREQGGRGKLDMKLGVLSYKIVAWDNA